MSKARTGIVGYVFENTRRLLGVITILFIEATLVRVRVWVSMMCLRIKSARARKVKVGTIDARRNNANSHETGRDKNREKGNERRMCECVWMFANMHECMGERGKTRKWNRKNVETLPSQTIPDGNWVEVSLTRGWKVCKKKYISLFFSFMLRTRTRWQRFVAMPLSVTHPFCLYKINRNLIRLLITVRLL